MFKINNFWFLFIAIIGIISIHSCDKKPIDIPVVVFEKPHENSNYSVGDTIDIHVITNSISTIKSVEFTLVNEDLIPVLANYIYPTNGENSMDIHFSFPIDDYYMEGGDYQILCKVTNEVETKYKYQSILLSGITKVLEDVAVVTKSGSKIKVWSLGAHLSKSPELRFQSQGDYSSSSYLPFYHRFAMAGAVSGDLLVWDYFSGDTVQQIPYSANPPFPFFSGVTSVQDYLAVSYYQGSVVLYNYLAKPMFTVAMQSGFYPHKVIDVSPNFMVIQKQKNGFNQLISLHLGKTASQHASFNLQGEIVDAFPFEDKDFMIFFNSSGQGYIEKYIYDNNATTEPVSYHGSDFRSIAQIDSKNYLLSAGNQLLWYQYAISSVSPILTGKELDFIQYDPLSKRVYACEGQTIIVFSVPSGQLISSQIISEEVLNIHLIYNK